MANALWIVQQSGEGVIAIISVLGNALVLVTLRRSGLLRSPTNCLIASLASADLLVGAVGIPCAIATNFSLPRDFYACLVTNCAVVIMTQSSIFSLLLIALERFAAVVAPVAHRRHLGRKTVALSVGAAWTSAVLLGLVPLFGWHPPPEEPTVNATDFACSFIKVIDLRYMVLFNSFGCVLTPLVIIYAIYGYIYNFILRKLREAVEAKDSSSSGDSGSSASSSSSSSKLKKESSVTKRIFLILVSFTVAWMPIHIMNIVTLFAHRTNFTGIVVAVLFSHANSALNPLTYALTNPKIMDGLKRTLGLRSKSVGIDPGQSNCSPRETAVQRGS